MKRKLLILLLLTVCAFALTSCYWTDTPENPNSPDTGNTDNGNENDNTDPGVSTHKHTEVEIPAYPATCTTAGFSAGKKCSECGEILLHQQPTMPPPGHDIGENGCCKNCDHIEYTEGLLFNEINDGSEYEVSGIGTAAVTYINIPDTFEGKPVTKIANYAFKENTTVKSVCVPDSVKEIGRFAFKDCASLESVKLGNSVIGIEASLFSGCRSLASINIPDSVTYIRDKAFEGCIKLPLEDEGGVCYLGNWAFYYGTSTDDMSLTFRNTTVGIADSAFKNGKSMNIKIPGNIKYIGRFAFENNDIWRIEFEEGLISIDTGAFKNCLSIGFNNPLNLPDSIEYIGVSAFQGCIGLRNLKLPKNLKTVDSKAFADCELQTVTMYNNIEAINENSFNCMAPFIINYNGTQAEWDAITKHANWTSPFPPQINFTETDN